MKRLADKIGFVLVTHNNPDQILRLVRRLNRMFGDPRIVCHHDFSQCALPEDMPSNVSFVRPHLGTAWAEFSVVEATVQAIRQMYDSGAGPDWFVLLSGADYPIKAAKTIIRDLEAETCDACICHELIKPRSVETDWQMRCNWRYFDKHISVPHVTRKFQFVRRKIKLPFFLSRHLIPYSENFHCYAGSQWFCANRRAARHIIERGGMDTPLARHARHVRFADEMYFQTLLANSKSLRLQNQNHRYLDWSEQGSHPKTLTMEDLTKLLASPCHFARKFAPDRPEILDAIDAAIDSRAEKEFSRSAN